MASFDFSAEIKDLRSIYASIVAVSDLEGIKCALEDLSQQASAPELWDDPEHAQRVTSALSHKQAELNRLTNLASRIDDVGVMVELAQTEDESSAEDLLAEAEAECKELRKKLDELEVLVLLSGEYDQREAVVTIRSGAGGVDAADFAEMLLRMYLRWAEKNGYPTKVLDTSYAEEAGLKSVTFEVNAPYAFGRLSVEAGTHRLVRISPFDNQGRRQTSFAAVEVIPLIEQTDALEIPESEIKVDVFRSSGPGGQSVNTTDSAVRMTHIPTGIVVSMQNEKSQIQNRAAALRVLQSRLLMLRQEQEDAKKKELAGDIKASWGDQMRSYVLHPYQMVKDLRTGYEEGNTSSVLDGGLNRFIEEGIRWRASGRRVNEG
ncbi:peptide chain release factor 2 [Rothia dentocariosa]|uniref:peptide chain release factor 2 n=1 Tax=Rothia dentocariosa TaxID=2047 RepID=UPI001072D96D|nr:peptide chain release factor 2 [Rothia dentocariosa]QXT28566.1 peptide chain release factor 2 [Rothia dentocariosa]TFI32327.1 peptide chain release factor 2 [Rothia dentocariosa]